MLRRLIMMLLMLALSNGAVAFISITPASQTDSVNWAGGDLTGNFNFCVLSSNGFPLFTPAVPYSVTGTVSGATPFTLESGTDSIPVTLEWLHIQQGIRDTLQPGVPTAEIFPGLSFFWCPNGDNGRLIVSITESDLVAAVPGTYSQTFDITVGNSGTGANTDTAQVTLTVTIPDSIQVTQLDDIYLGSFDAVSDLSGSDSLCVFRRGGGPYGVRITGSGPGGAFTLEHNTSSIPFSVTWNDGGGAQPVDPGVLISGLSNAYSGDPQCAGGGANNATVGVQVLASDIAASATETGPHVGVLTITVEMQ